MITLSRGVKRQRDVFEGLQSNNCDRTVAQFAAGRVRQFSVSEAFERNAEYEIIAIERQNPRIGILSLAFVWRKV
jgi:hypothetical protein